MSKANSNRRKKNIKLPKVSHAVFHVFTTMNNTIVSLARENGDVLSQTSPAACGFKNCRKVTPHAVQTCISRIVHRASEDFAVKSAKLVIKGFGIARDMISLFYESSKIEITEIVDITSIPYNGVRPPKARSV